MIQFKLLCLTFLITQFSIGQQTDSRLTGLDNEIQNLLQAYHAAGLSIAVIENDKTIYSKGFGYRDVERMLPVTPNTIFPIGSITKSFTASLLGMLESQNKLSLKDKPAFYIPKLQFYTEDMDNLITIEDLLCHRTGIGGVDGSYVLFPAKTRESLMPRLKYLKPNGTVKDTWIYSNMGYIVAGTIIEKLTNESWEKTIRDSVFTPLKMYRSNTSISDMTASGDFSFGYGLTEGMIRKVMFAELDNDKPGGAINSNANEMLNWMKTWLNHGSFNAKEILPKSYVQAATSMKAIDDGLPPEISDPGVYTFGYGYGWKVNSNKGHYKVHHGGNVSGFSSQLVMYPTDKLGIIVLTNQHNSILPYVIADVVTNRMLKIQRIKWDKYPVQIDEAYIPSTENKALNSAKRNTHGLSDYCGKYSNLGYGTFEVVTRDSTLLAVFPALTFGLEHKYYDVFTLTILHEMPQVMSPGFFVNFFTNEEGNIGSLKINFQNDPVEFKRVDE
jgi:CubicO group peptidase (beta-lactamase class C family)